MLIEVKLPTLGEDILSAVVAKILVAAGDDVDVDQSLLELETDKVIVELPSPNKGKIVEVHVKTGDEVQEGQVLFSLESGD